MSWLLRSVKTEKRHRLVQHITATSALEGTGSQEEGTGSPAPKKAKAAYAKDVLAQWEHPLFALLDSIGDRGGCAQIVPNELKPEKSLRELNETLIAKVKRNIENADADRPIHQWPDAFKVALLVVRYYLASSTLWV